ncbi:hypothetical protein C5167_036171 [Papaver somniferum]|nr:hypothetical protein C5167_036171 [Papaver somniferum]
MYQFVESVMRLGYVVDSGVLTFIAIYGNDEIDMIVDSQTWSRVQWERINPPSTEEVEKNRERVICWRSFLTREGENGIWCRIRTSGSMLDQFLSGHVG